MTAGIENRNTPAAQACTQAIDTAYAAGLRATCTTLLPTAILSGTLFSGVYCSSPGTLSLASKTFLILDGKNVSSSQWIFQAATTVIFDSYSTMVLKNGAVSANVWWTVGSSATIGTSSIFYGQILAQASIIIKPFTLVGGRALAKASVTFENSAYVDILHTSTTPANITVARCKKYDLVGSTLAFGTGRSVVSTGLIGVYPAQSITGNYSVLAGPVQFSSRGVQYCVSDLATAFNAAATAACSNYLADLSGLTLTSGVYCSSTGTLSIGVLSYLTLDGSNVASSQWVFQTASTLTTGSKSSIILKNGALAANVFWAVGSSASIGYGSFIVGNILAFSSITTSQYSVVFGRGLSLGAVSVASYGAFSLPEGTSPVVYPTRAVYMGGCSAFAALAGTTMAWKLMLTVIHTGSIGVSPGTAITGTYRLDAGTAELSSTAANQCKADLPISYGAAAGMPCGNFLAGADMSGLTLLPGVYCTAPGTVTLSPSSRLTLDAGGDATAVFIIQTTTSLAT